MHWITPRLLRFVFIFAITVVSVYIYIYIYTHTHLYSYIYIKPKAQEMAFYSKYQGTITSTITNDMVLSSEHFLNIF
jgi:hypothetical protein